MIRNLTKDFDKNFALPDAGDNTEDPLNGGGISDSLLFRKVLANLLNVSIPKVSASDKFFCFISISKFDSFKKPFATIASLYELPFPFSFIPLIQMK